MPHASCYQRIDFQIEQTVTHDSQPTRVASGSDDTMLPAANAYAMFMALSTAHHVLYPDSGHGALFQRHETFASHVRSFLEA